MHAYFELVCLDLCDMKDKLIDRQVSLCFNASKREDTLRLHDVSVWRFLQSES